MFLFCFLVENMVTVGKTILERNNFTDFKNVRYDYFPVEIIYVIGFSEM